tara:strand:+ start:314 stop:1141 length:828 start_codon:yes stop_codon:yes gene_type:complete
MFKSLNNSLYEIISNLFNEKDRNSIIEPLICLVRLAILDFKPIGTKISIFNNRITYNEPNILQGAVRWSNGDARDDLHNIYLPIIKAAKWYDVKQEDIKNIFTFSIRGLEKLKQSYSRNSTINHSIQYYIDTLKNSLNTSNLSENFTRNSIKNNDGNRNNDRRSNRNKHSANNSTNIDDDSNSQNDNNGTAAASDVEREDENNTIFNKLKGIWNEREISIINNLLIEMESRRGVVNEESIAQSESDTIIMTLETLLKSKENKVSDLIIKSTTLLE